MNKSRSQAFYEKAKGRICAAMEESAAEAREHAIKHKFSEEEAEAYIEDSCKFLAALSIVALRLTSLILFNDGAVEESKLWEEACDRLEKEFM